jgi:hypothetical protein
MSRLVALERTDVSEELSASIIIRVTRRCSWFTDSCYPDDGGAKILRYVGSYKGHTA